MRFRLKVLTDSWEVWLKKDLIIFRFSVVTRNKKFAEISALGQELNTATFCFQIFSNWCFVNFLSLFCWVHWREWENSSCPFHSVEKSSHCCQAEGFQGNGLVDSEARNFIAICFSLHSSKFIVKSFTKSRHLWTLNAFVNKTHLVAKTLFIHRKCAFANASNHSKMGKVEL